MPVRASDRVTLVVLPAPSYVRTYYLLQSSTLAAPAVPTTNPPAAPWTITEPAYSAGSTTTLYTVMLTAYGEAAFEYGPVQVSSSYEAAKQAYNRASTAITAANGLAKVIHSVTSPSGSAPKNSTWFQHQQVGTSTTDLSGPVIAQWTQTASGTGSTWVGSAIASEAIANLDVGKLTAGNATLSDIVAQEIAAASAQFLAIDAAQLTASEAVLDEATVQKLFTDVVVAQTAIADAFIGESALFDGTVTARLLDVDALNGKEIYGAYIEGPLIASSANLGTGSNVLTDPRLSSTADTAWVASGFLGDDEGHYQDDVLTWDQSWQYTSIMGEAQTRRNRGSVRTRTAVKPITRRTGSLVFKNDAWLPANRTVTNPFNFTDTGWYPTHGGGKSDPTFLAHDLPNNASTVARTTYLTNSAVTPITAGDVWQYQLAFTSVTERRAPYLSAWLELVDTAGTVRWSRQLTTDELSKATSVRGSITADFTANVQLRVKATYVAGGGGIERTTQSGAFARQLIDGALDTNYEPPIGTSYPPNRAPGTSSSEYTWNKGDRTLRYWDYGGLEWRITSALLAQASPERGFRLASEDGLELFDSLGAQTGRLDGEDNFLAGTFATAESGERLELSTGEVRWFDAYDTQTEGITPSDVGDWRRTNEQASRLPWAMTSGGLGLPPLAPGSNTDMTVTFPTGRFTVAPVVTPSVSQQRLQVAVADRTATGCTLRIWNDHPTATISGHYVYWSAMQFTETNASG
ncbi:hypothetical protein [Microbacterium excoecariae]|uniref:hypothetical protein n=1 Tax=Microbacterium excoecariae TaxID=2715210 RepID=UPI001408A64B|nr:hypothetical protein [Microbacterium excoecariae]NHI16875.1 hypothetical protein [Microbacterium excoecariae]